MLKRLVLVAGHTRGILAMSWCPFDPGMLLTCGKDDRTLCWNPQVTTQRRSNLNFYLFSNLKKNRSSFLQSSRKTRAILAKG